MGKKRITIFLDDAVYQKIQELATASNRSLASVGELLVLKALTDPESVNRTLGMAELWLMGVSASGSS